MGVINNFLQYRFPCFPPITPVLGESPESAATDVNHLVTWPPLDTLGTTQRSQALSGFMVVSMPQDYCWAIISAGPIYAESGGHQHWLWDWMTGIYGRIVPLMVTLHAPARIDILHGIQFDIFLIICPLINYLVSNPSLFFNYYLFRMRIKVCW